MTSGFLAGKERIRVKGFANVPGFETIHRCNLDARAVKTWLGRDTIQAYLTTDGQIVDVQTSATLRDGISHAAMDLHGRLLAISQGVPRATALVNTLLTHFCCLSSKKAF